MLTYLEYVLTDVPNRIGGMILGTHYYYEDLTGVMYSQNVCTPLSREENKLTDLLPLPKPDGSYLTYSEWCELKEAQNQKTNNISKVIENLNITLE